MYRVTRKQLIKNGMGADWAVIRFEDYCEFENFDTADLLRHRLLINEVQVGYRLECYGKAVFETPTFYRSVTVTIEEVS